MLGPLYEKAKQKSLLWKVLMISLALHVVIVLIAGPLVIFSHVFKREVLFEPGPEPIRRIDPRELQFKVNVKEVHEKSGRPRVQPRMTAARVSDFALPAIDIEVAMIKSKALPTLKNFSDFGMGSGLGTGKGSGGLGVGESGVNFFGIKARGERIAFLIDVSPSMLEDSRGGLQGFATIKEEIGRMVNRLSPGTFFNAVTFSHDVDIYSPKMLLANRQNKKALKEWLAPYNTDSASQRYGSLYANYMPQTTVENFNPLDGTTRLDMALTAAFEQGADTVFLLTDGVPKIRKELTPDKWREWQKKYHSKVEQRKVARLREKWQKEMDRENKKRAKKGLPPKIVENPPSLLQPTITEKEVLEYIQELQKQLYKDKNRKESRIHVVGYETDKATESFLRLISRENHGRFRRLSSNFKPISKKSKKSSINKDNKM